MIATTLAVVNAPTLADGMVELLRIGDALHAAGGDCGVSVQRHPDGWLFSAEPDYDVPPGVIETSQRVRVDPWLHMLSAMTDRDLIATADGLYLQ